MTIIYDMTTPKPIVIYYNEFLAATLETQGRVAEVRLAEAFNRLDSDGSGFICKEVSNKII